MQDCSASVTTSSVDVPESLARVGLATGEATASSMAVPDDGIFGVVGLLTKLVLGASTSTTSASCSLAVSSWFLIAETVVFKRLPSILSSSVNNWSNSLLTGSVCFLAETAAVGGWAQDLFAGGSDDIPVWKAAPVILLVVIQSGLVVVSAGGATAPLSPCGVVFLFLF